VYERGENSYISREGPSKSRFYVLNKNDRGGSLKPAVPPSGNDEVRPSEHVSGQQHGDDGLEQKGDLLESLSISGGEKGGDGGGAGNGDLGISTRYGGLGSLGSCGNLGSLVQVVFDIPTGSVGSGEPVSNNTGLLLRLWLVSGALDLALVEAALDADGKGVRNELGNPDGLVDPDIAMNHISDIRGEAEKSLADGRNTRVFMVKASDKGDGITAEVGLVVEGVLGVDETLIGDEGVLDESGTVF